MPNILVVDDSPTQRQMAGGLLATQAGCEVTYAANGQEAMQLMGQHLPDLVLTDLQMPAMDGLELVTTVKNDFPMVPVILMTAVGSEDIAAEALRRGAASYVPKRRLAEDLTTTVAHVLAASHADRDHPRLMHYLEEQESAFALRSDLVLIQALVRYVQQVLRSLPLGDEMERLRVGIALEEALKNAFYHGNLELGQLGQPNGPSLEELVRQRLGQSPYQERQIHVRMRISREEAVFIVRDEGPGFDTARLADPDMAAADAGGGRGITLMRSIMDEVHYNAAGNEVALIKRRTPETPADAAETTL